MMKNRPDQQNVMSFSVSADIRDLTIGLVYSIVYSPRVGVSASCPVKAIFHYAIQVADLVCDLLQTGSSYLDVLI